MVDRALVGCYDRIEGSLFLEYKLAFSLALGWWYVREGYTQMEV